jgi:hypothetical protein
MIGKTIKTRSLEYYTIIDKVIIDNNTAYLVHPFGTSHVMTIKPNIIQEILTEEQVSKLVPVVESQMYGITST